MTLRLGSSSSVCSAVFDPNEITISIDLIETTKYLLEFLSEISSKPELYEGPLVECAVQRYERYWLPLVSKHPGRLLPAPLDIEWVWHCHMLCPHAYNTDCKNIVGKVIDHHLIDRAKRKELICDSERLWRKEYTDVPFSACDAVTPWFDCEFVSALTYRLASAVYKQTAFFYQVSLPHYRDDTFLSNALLRYKKFLFLKFHNPGMFLVPCYDTDLIWHTHMLHPHFYKDDTQNYLGYLLLHDDSVNDRTPGSKLSLFEAKTRNLWRKVLNEKFSCFGAMYRGEPPNSMLSVMSREDICSVCTKQVNVQIEKICILGLPAGKTHKLKLCYNTGYQNFNRSLYVTENIATMKGNSRFFQDSKMNTHFQFDTRYNDKIIAVLRQRSGMLCLGTSDIVAEGKVDLLKKIQPLNSKGINANDDIECGEGVSIGMAWSCPAPTLGPCVLRLEPGEYESCVMPEDRETMWGPIPLPRLPPGIDNVCSVASHQLFNHTKKVVFTVRMIHSEALLMSAVQVFHGDKLCSVAHLIVGDQLPLPDMVTDAKKCITLNPKEGQRAVLIKNHKGDWGVAVGWWEGFQRRVAGRKGSCSEGHLEVRFFHLPNNRWHYVSFDRLYSLATSKFEIGDCIVEFDSGFIEINSQREIAENLGLIFSVALIHVLCQPRPLNWAPKMESVSPDEEPLPRLGGSEEIGLLLAAGVLIATPCNQAIRNLFKKKKQQFGKNFRHGNKKAVGQYDQSGNSAGALHEGDGNKRWSDDWKAGGGSTHTDVAETSLVVSGILSAIKEQTDTDSEDGAEEKPKPTICSKVIDAEVTDVTDRTALLLNTDDDEKEEEGLTGTLNGCLQQNDGEDNVHHNQKARDEEDEDEQESDLQSEGVFEVERHNVDANCQTGQFGNGEDDSDEADPEAVEEDHTGFRPDSSVDEADDIFAVNQSFESDKVLENFPDAGHNGAEEGGFENDEDNYYDEFYNIDGDDNAGNFPENEGEINREEKAEKNVWDAYGGNAATFANESSTDYGGFGSGGYGEADGSFGIGTCVGGQDASDGGYSHFTSGLLYDAEVNYGGAGGGNDIFGDGICSGGGGGECIEAVGGDGESGF